MRIVVLEDLQKVLNSNGASSDSKIILGGDWNIVQDVMKETEMVVGCR